MIVTITSIRLRSVWQFFTLSNHGRKIQGQAKRSPGFLRMKNTGWGKLHYTVSAWESEPSLKQFARAGAHLEAMKQSGRLSTEIRTYTYETDALPSWKEVKQLLAKEGKVMRF